MTHKPKDKLTKNFHTEKGKKQKQAKLEDIDFRGGNANIWIKSYQKEEKQKGRKHFIK